MTMSPISHELSAPGGEEKPSWEPQARGVLSSWQQRMEVPHSLPIRFIHEHQGKMREDRTMERMTRSNH